MGKGDNKVDTTDGVGRRGTFGAAAKVVQWEHTLQGGACRFVSDACSLESRFFREKDEKCKPDERSHAQWRSAGKAVVCQSKHDRLVGGCCLVHSRL